MYSDPRPELGAVLTDLTRLDDVLAAAVIRNDGLLIEHRLPEGTDPKKIATMAAAVVGISELAAESLGRDRFLRSVIEADDGKILSMRAGREIILFTLVKKDCNVGLVLMAIEKAGRRLTEILINMGGLRAAAA